MKKIRFLFTILVCIAISTSAAYAQNDKFSKSRSGSFSSSSSSKSSSSSSKSSASKTSSSSSSKKTSTSQSRPSSYSSQRRTSNSYSNSSSSTSKASRSNSTYSSSRSTATPSRQQSTSSRFSSSYSGSKASSSPAERATRSTSARSTSTTKTRTATANINHSRERLAQRTRTLTKTPSGSTSKASGTQRTASSASAAMHSVRASNFVYSPQKNSVMKMHPSSLKPKSSARQMTHSGLWSQCQNNWSGTQTTNKSLVQTYAKQNLNMELIDYGFSGGILYVIAEDSKGTFLQACNQDGTVLDEQEIIRGYKTIVTTEENSGCWIVKKNDADPLYYSFDGTHLTKYIPDEGKDIIDFDFCEMVTYTITRENQHTYFQIYNDTDQQPIASTEINGDFNTIDVEADECRCYIKDPENNQSAEMIWLGDEIMIMEEE